MERGDWSSLEGIPPDIDLLVDRIDQPKVGFFGPESATWHVARERVVRLCGVSTILLQLAHPKVAKGVADHSEFEADPVARFERTFDLVDAVLFGDRDTALEAALAIRGTHERVSGTLEESVGPFDGGEAYDATDPALLQWVHATLIEQSIAGYEHYVGSLAADTWERYYQEAITVGRLLGVPAERYPETLDGFHEYYEQMIRSELAVGSVGRRQRETLEREGPGPAALYEFFAGPTLPPSMREAYGVPWSDRREWLFQRMAGGSRRFTPRLPARLRFIPAYRDAMVRVGQ
ncbi:MAG: oxygenase MpaB family protein [Natrialbaceae archaeon]|nr:oxygenase MpaB family protein [Natrialbaceae archaeon]